ncbi:MAG: hypothetical protein ASARMPRED_007846, partial [Alectoria sarmentosa]
MLSTLFLTSTLATLQACAFPASFVQPRQYAGSSVTPTPTPYNPSYPGNSGSSVDQRQAQGYAGQVQNDGSQPQGSPSVPGAAQPQPPLHTKFKAWQPPNGLFFVNVDKMQATQAYITDGVTIVYQTGKVPVPGVAQPTKVADFQIFYEGELLEGVALLDDQGVPNELLDTLSCKVGHGNVAECELYDWNGSTIGSSKTTTLTGYHKKIRATNLLAVQPDYYQSGVVATQVASMTDGGAVASKVTPAASV